MNAKIRIPIYRVKLVREPTTLTCREPVEASNVLRRLVVDSSRESMHVLYVDGRNKLMGAEMIGIGGIDSLTVAVRDIVRGAIVAGAHGIILGHNHPSGSVEPSAADIVMTRAVERACDAVGLPLLDHIITTDHYGHFSMLDHGLLGPNQEESS